MRNQTILRAILIILLIVFIGIIILHFISAFVFRNLVIESKNKPVLSLPSRDSYEEHDVKFSRNLLGVKNVEQKVRLWYFPLNTKQDNSTTIVFCSPSSATLPRLQKMKYLADALSSNLVMFEYRPNGSSSGIISPSMSTLTEDVEYVLSWLRSEKNVRMEDIILMGYSLGGLPAISAALKFKEINRLALVNSFCSFSCVTKERFSSLLSGFLLFKDFFPELTEAVKELTQTVVIIFSLEDRVIPRKCTQHMIKSLQNTSSKLEIAISGGHSIFKIEEEQLLMLRGFLGINDNSDDIEERISRSIRLFNEHQVSLHDDQ